MWRAERHQRIRALLDTFDQVSVDQLVTELAVSRETVRRDVKELEAAGALRRVHGGIASMQDSPEAPYRKRALINRREKQEIAALCRDRISAGQTLFIDAGSTTRLLAQALAGLSGLQVFTNSLDVAAHLGTAASRRRQNRVILLGGDYADQPPATMGAMVLSAISRISADVAICSPFGLTAGEGATSYVIDEAEIARAMFARATRRIVLADHSKLGVRGRVSFAPLAEIDLLITDARARRLPHHAALAAEMGQRLICG
ncbi:MAG: DeoR/GlpR transcriptional regulator [Rubellimicrobium sp.]|nr:DeoR/GlpR transcriptional regulator [Rubellimicrobium sp.]